LVTPFVCSVQAEGGRGLLSGRAFVRGAYVRRGLCPGGLCPFPLQYNPIVHVIASNTVDATISYRWLVTCRSIRPSCIRSSSALEKRTDWCQRSRTSPYRLMFGCYGETGALGEMDRVLRIACPCRRCRVKENSADFYPVYFAVDQPWTRYNFIPWPIFVACNKKWLKIPPHLKRVTALPCEILVF